MRFEVECICQGISGMMAYTLLNCGEVDDLSAIEPVALVGKQRTGECQRRTRARGDEMLMADVDGVSVVRLALVLGLGNGASFLLRSDGVVADVDDGIDV